VDVLERRAREFNIPKSILTQILLEIEEREHLLRRELVARLAPVAQEQPRTSVRASHDFLSNAKKSGLAGTLALQTLHTIWATRPTDAPESPGFRLAGAAGGG